MNHKKLETLLAHFGTCGCKHHCAKEQYADENDQNEAKPNGRYSICEIEAEDCGIQIHKETMGDE